ncbi:MAG: glycosyltransferase family 4 protein [Bacillota bacterium]|nr:glycosyltransferase family 4 protein [Bacillota bacterium]
MNVALVSHSPYLCGAERSILYLAGLFSGETKGSGIHTILLVPELENGELAAAASQYNYEMVNTPQQYWYLMQSHRRIQEFDSYCSIMKDHIKSFIDLYKKTNADIVLVNTLTSITPLIAAYMLGIPTVTWIHGLIKPSMVPGIDPYYQSVIDRSMINISSRLVYCSNWTRQQFKDLVPVNKGVTIPNWMPEASMHIPYNKAGRTFVCLNTLEPHKGINVLIDAAKILKDRGIEFHVDLYGLGYGMPDVIKQINFLELNDVVHIKGRTVDIEKVYNECNVLIQPSLYESFGRTILEAMSFNRPVICTTSADPEGVTKDGTNGFRIEPDNSFILADKMAYMLDNPQKAEVMGNKGYKLYKAYYDGNFARKEFTKLFNEMYKHRLTLPSQQYAFDVVNIIHKCSFEYFDLTE